MYMPSAAVAALLPAAHRVEPALVAERLRREREATEAELDRAQRRELEQRRRQRREPRAAAARARARVNEERARRAPPRDPRSETGGGRETAPPPAATPPRPRRDQRAMTAGRRDATRRDEVAASATSSFPARDGDGRRRRRRRGRRKRDTNVCGAKRPTHDGRLDDRALAHQTSRVSSCGQPSARFMMDWSVSRLQPLRATSHQGEATRGRSRSREGRTLQEKDG